MNNECKMQAIVFLKFWVTYTDHSVLAALLKGDVRVRSIDKILRKPVTKRTQLNNRTSGFSTMLKEPVKGSWVQLQFGFRHSVLIH